MLIDPRLIGEHLPAVLALTVAVVVGKVTGVGFGSFLAGQDVRTSIQAGMSLAQIGEFSFIIAGVGLATNATGEFMYPIAVAVSAITTLLAPFLIGASDRAATYVDRHLPERLENFVSLYATWVERVRAGMSRKDERAPVRRLLRWIVLDAGVLTLVVGAVGLVGDELILMLQDVGFTSRVARLVVALAAGAACLPFAIGILRCVRKLSTVLADAAFPRGATGGQGSQAGQGGQAGQAGQGGMDLGDAPRRALVGTLQLATLLLVGAPLVAVTQPFVGGFGGAAVLAVVIALCAIALWRSMGNLQGHTRAVAQVIAEALMRRVQEGRSDQDDPLSEVRKLMPGLGEPVALRLDGRSPSVGKSLAQINVRGSTGATVLAVVRGQDGVVEPEGAEILRENDILAITGTSTAIEAARRLLETGDPRQR
jgi:CPA2 family monovalent cation:H+ antiporter-2